MNYIINETKIKNENNKEISTYGITYINKPNMVISDISINKKKVENLVELCNKNNLSPLHLMDVIDDFLVDFEVWF